MLFFGLDLHLVTELLCKAWWKTGDSFLDWPNGYKVLTGLRTIPFQQHWKLQPFVGLFPMYMFLSFRPGYSHYARLLTGA